MAGPRRYYARSPDGRAIFGFDRAQAAETVALEYGIGATIVDTLAQVYTPMLQEVLPGDGGPRLVLAPIGGWGAGRFDLDRDLIEAVKKGHEAIVHAFLAKGASANARDARGGSALHWAAGRGKIDVVALLLAEGADVDARDGAGRTALDVAECRSRSEIAELLRRRGAL